MLINPKILPDVIRNQKSHFSSCLQWVGMERVTLPLTLSGGEKVEAWGDVFVNVINEEAKGIHMSRLYLIIHEIVSQRNLSVDMIREILKKFVQSQEGLSDSAKVVLRWNEMYKRQALLSEFSGWRSYPLELGGELIKDNLKIYLKFSIFYSSTCPCSSALSRQIYQQDFKKEFSGDSVSFDKVSKWLGETSVAAPHSQRSRADITLTLKNPLQSVSFIRFIDKIETDIKTVVQTAVKREDEQEFARLNGQNTMFVEDALRVMKKSMGSFKEVESFEIKTRHFESLHVHDAVGSIISG